MKETDKRRTQDGNRKQKVYKKNIKRRNKTYRNNNNRLQKYNNCIEIYMEILLKVGQCVSVSFRSNQIPMHGLLLLRWRNYCAFKTGCVCSQGGCLVADFNAGVFAEFDMLCIFNVYIFYLFCLTVILYFMPTDSDINKFPIFYCVILGTVRNWTVTIIFYIVWKRIYCFVCTVSQRDVYKGNYYVLLFIYVCSVVNYTKGGDAALRPRLRTVVCVCIMPRLKTHSKKTDTRDDASDKTLLYARQSNWI